MISRTIARKRDSIAHISVLSVCLGVIFLLFGTATAEASTLSVLPAGGSFARGESFTVSVNVNADQSINAVTGALRFPTSKLRVLRVEKNSNSIVNLWTLEPAFSNTGESGNVTFEGVILNPGFLGEKGKVLAVTFEVVAEGSAEVTFGRAAVLANDGKGTSLFVSTLPGTYALTPPRPASAQKSQPASGEGSAPSQIVVIREVMAPVIGDYFWDMLPGWVRVLVIISIGITTTIFGFIIASLGILILIWMWRNVWHRRMQFVLFLKLVAMLSQKGVRKAVRASEFAGEELWEDVRYTFRQLKKEIVHAGHSRSLSFRQLLVDYVQLIGRILKRFFTKNARYHT